MPKRMGLRKYCCFCLVSLLAITFIVGCAVEDEPEAQPEALPEVPQAAIDDAIAEIEEYAVVQEAGVFEGDSEEVIILAVIVTHGTTEEAALDIADSFVRLLASFACVWGDEFEETPTADYYGDLWEHYTAHIGVGPSADEFIAQGVLLKGSNKITW